MNNLFVCFINQLDCKNTDPFIVGFCRNLAEYWIRNAIYYLPDRYNSIKIFKTHEEALNYLYNQEKYEHALFFDLGNDLQGGSYDNFFVDFLPTIDPNKDVIVGHILDRKERYYELHDQCFYLNIKILKQLDKPSFGNKDSELTYIAPIRSKENHHDNYTPLWISKGKQSKKYTDLKFGHHIISKVLQHNYKIRSFSEDDRDAKIYFYPENKQEFYKKINTFFVKNYQFKFYPINTEPIKDFDFKKISNFTTVSAGLNHLCYLKKYGYTKNLKINFFDVNEYALSIMSDLYKNWDGYDYTNIITNNMITVSDREKNQYKEFINHYFGNEENFAAWFKELRDNANVKFYKLDLFNTDSYNFNRIINSFIDSEEGQKIFWISNIFNYRNNCLIQNTEALNTIVNNFTNKIKNIKDFACVGEKKIFDLDYNLPLDKQNKIINEYFCWN